ncbi:uncharacterized protein LOC144004903 [Festucalex cinctus]
MNLIQSDYRSNNMKSVLVALLIFVLLSQCEALRCYCQGKSDCPGSEETCSPPDNACSTSIPLVPLDLRPQDYPKGCAMFHKCQKATLRGTFNFCCTGDLCNS